MNIIIKIFLNARSGNERNSLEKNFRNTKIKYTHAHAHTHTHTHTHTNKNKKPRIYD